MLESSVRNWLPSEVPEEEHPVRPRREAAAVDHVGVPREDRLQQGGVVGRVVLEVGVLDDQHVAGRQGEPGAQRRALAAVDLVPAPGEGRAAPCHGRRLPGPQDLRRGVPRVVVHGDELQLVHRRRQRGTRPRGPGARPRWMPRCTPGRRQRPWKPPCVDLRPFPARAVDRHVWHAGDAGSRGAPAEVPCRVIRMTSWFCPSRTSSTSTLCAPGHPGGGRGVPAGGPRGRPPGGPAHPRPGHRCAEGARPGARWRACPGWKRPGRPPPTEAAGAPPSSCSVPPRPTTGLTS